MSDVVPASEHMKSLVAFYQTAEKMLRQAEADVAFAKKRREEARKIKDDAMARLEEAQVTYNVADIQLPNRSPSLVELSKKLVKKTVPHQGKQKGASRGRSKSLSHGGDGYKSDDPVASVGYRRTRSRQKSAILNSQSDHLSTATGSPMKHRSRHSKVPKPPKIGSPGGRRSSVGSALPRRGSMLISKGLVSPVLGICRGRSREWYEANIDCESLGLVKRFYQAALGTKTHAASNQIYISSVLLNDEWNDLASDTSEVQELYIGVSSNSDGKETLRDRAARALIQPPQEEPLAIFFAPKNKLGTDDVYYGGHWKVVAGNMFDPPQVMKGTPRQCLVKLVFSGVDPEIVNVVNAD